MIHEQKFNNMPRWDLSVTGNQFVMLCNSAIILFPSSRFHFFFFSLCGQLPFPLLLGEKIIQVVCKFEFFVITDKILTTKFFVVFKYTVNWRGSNETFMCSVELHWEWTVRMKSFIIPVMGRSYFIAWYHVFIYWCFLSRALRISLVLWK